MICPICHKEWPNVNMVITEIENYQIILCPSCYTIIGRCNSCDYSRKCDFHEDNSEPQVIPKTIQQGPAIFTTQVKNPHLIEKHCSTCRCSFETQYCLRDDNNGLNCNNYKIAPEILNLGIEIKDRA